MVDHPAISAKTSNSISCLFEYSLLPRLHGQQPISRFVEELCPPSVIGSPEIHRAVALFLEERRVEEVRQI